MSGILSTVGILGLAWLSMAVAFTLCVMLALVAGWHVSIAVTLTVGIVYGLWAGKGC